MAHLQHQAGIVRSGGQPIGLFQRGRQRFFHQHMAAGQQGAFREVEMRIGWGRDDHGITGGKQRLERQGRCAAGLGADTGRPVGIEVANAGQGGARRGGDFQGVEAAEMAGADNADAECVCHARGVADWQRGWLAG